MQMLHQSKNINQEEEDKDMMPNAGCIWEGWEGAPHQEKDEGRDERRRGKRGPIGAA